MREHPTDRLFKTLNAAIQRGRVARYFARIDAHMQGISERERLTFLRAELDKWMARYQRFQAQVDGGEDLEGDVTAWDFAETIATLAARIGRLEKVPA